MISRLIRLAMPLSVLAALAGCARIQLPRPTLVDAEDVWVNGGAPLSWVNPEAPPEFQHSVQRLNRSIESMGCQEPQVVISPDGQSVLAFDLHESKDEPGVWMWPDWREPEHVERYRGAVWGTYASPTDVWIHHRDGSEVVRLSTGMTRVPVSLNLSRLGIINDQYWVGIDANQQLLMGRMADGIRKEACQLVNERAGAVEVSAMGDADAFCYQTRDGAFVVRRIDNGAEIYREDGILEWPGTSIRRDQSTGLLFRLSFDASGAIQEEQIEWGAGYHQRPGRWNDPDYRGIVWPPQSFTPYSKAGPSDGRVRGALYWALLRWTGNHQQFEAGPGPGRSQAEGTASVPSGSLPRGLRSW